MKTLIELYDDSAIENVIGPEVFRPEQVIYICPAEVAQDFAARETIRKFLHSRGVDVQVEYVGVSQYKADRIYQQLRGIVGRYEDCAVDVAGGTDAALIAAGMLCGETETPTFTYSRKRNRFYDISNASFADDLCCTLNYSVADFFGMTGGSLREGRVDNTVLPRYLESFAGFFDIYLKYRKKWDNQILFLQRISQKGGLYVCGSRYQKGERGARVRADEDFLKDLEQLGYIHGLKLEDEESVSFRFADEYTRAWLRDVGSVLELYMYKACVDAGIFGEVVSSAVVDWDGTVGHGSVSNEIDVAAARGVVPMFISCKACEVKTEALNELAILKERFGGKSAKAAIASTGLISAAARHRAAQLGIAVIDLEELSTGRASDRVRVIMKVDPELRSE